MLALEAAALIEDYFFVNTELVPFPRSDEQRELVDPFCITEEGYLIFNLAINYSSTTGPNNITPNITTRLWVNDENVATSFVFDLQEPTNVALFWEGVVEEDW